MLPSSALQWLSLVGIIWLQSINGTNSNFPAYSSQFKHLFSISQVQLNNLAFASDAGKLFGWLSGVAAVYLPLWVVLMIGATLGFIGYGVQFLFLVNKISSPSYWHIFILSVLAGNSICWINTVCYMVTIRNFRFHRQIAVGLSTSYVGLSAKVYNDIVNVVSSTSPIKRAKAYLLLNSILPLVVSMVTSPLFKEIEIKKTKGIQVGFFIMFVITIVTGIYAVIGSMGVSNEIPPWVEAMVLGLLLASPLVISGTTRIRESLGEKWSIKREGRVYDVNIDEIDVEEGGVKEGEDDKEESEIRMREEIGVKLMVRRVEFWLYFFVYMFGATLGLVFLNNLGEIAESRGHSQAASLVSLSSSFGFFGRLIPSLLDYFFSESKKYRISRPASIVLLMAPMTLAFFLLLNKTSISLYLSTAIIGVCTGAITSIAVSITSDLFGTKNFSVNHNIVVVNIPIGSFLFGYLAAILYQREGDDQGNEGCMGDECYKKTFIIWGSICSFGTLLSFILYVRTRKFFMQSSL